MSDTWRVMAGDGERSPAANMDADVGPVGPLSSCRSPVVGYTIAAQSSDGKTRSGSAAKIVFDARYGSVA